MARFIQSEVSCISINNEMLRLMKNLRQTFENTVPLSKSGARIRLDPSILQPQDVFTTTTYKYFVKQVKQIKAERHRLLTAVQAKMQKHSVRERARMNTPEQKKHRTVYKQYRSLTKEYRRRLPTQILAQCPYCGTHILQPVDIFSLLGFFPDFGALRVFGGHEDWHESSPFKQICPHALCATVSLNLHDVKPIDLSGWLGRGWIGPLEIAPRVIIWPLLARYTSAMIHAFPIGQLDDEVPIHRYTSYITTYFAADQSNLRTRELWVPTDVGGPATEGVWDDAQVNRWIEAGRLFWMDPENPARLVKGSVEKFPYKNVKPDAWYKIIEGGKIDGPYPNRAHWQGRVPKHDESYQRSIEHEEA